jgi:hypothetical protein
MRLHTRTRIVSDAEVELTAFSLTGSSIRTPTGAITNASRSNLIGSNPQRSMIGSRYYVQRMGVPSRAGKAGRTLWERTRSPTSQVKATAESRSPSSGLTP